MLDVLSTLVAGRTPMIALKAVLVTSRQAAQMAVYPPSAITVAPVMNDESLDARNATTEAISSGSPWRTIGATECAAHPIGVSALVEARGIDARRVSRA